MRYLWCRCPLFARKFTSDSQREVIHALFSLLMREESLYLATAGGRPNNVGFRGKEPETEANDPALASGNVSINDSAEDSSNDTQTRVEHQSAMQLSAVINESSALVAEVALRNDSAQLQSFATEPSIHSSSRKARKSRRTPG